MTLRFSGKKATRGVSRWMADPFKDKAVTSCNNVAFLFFPPLPVFSPLYAYPPLPSSKHKIRKKGGELHLCSHAHVCLWCDLQCDLAMNFDR